MSQLEHQPDEWAIYFEPTPMRGAHLNFAEGRPDAVARQHPRALGVRDAELEAVLLAPSMFHASSASDRTPVSPLPTKTWKLSEEGRRRARELRQRLQQPRDLPSDS